MRTERLGIIDQAIDVPESSLDAAIGNCVVFGLIRRDLEPTTDTVAAAVRRVSVLRILQFPLRHEIDHALTESKTAMHRTTDRYYSRRDRGRLRRTAERALKAVRATGLLPKCLRDANVSPPLRQLRWRDCDDEKLKWQLREGVRLKSELTDDLRKILTRHVNILRSFRKNI
jgi:DNA-binding transcriptional ArsR family regulator